MPLSDYAIFEGASFITRIMGRKHLGSWKWNECDDIPKDPVLWAIDIIIQQFMPKERLWTEWGIFASKGPFPTFFFPLTPNSRQRYKIVFTWVKLLDVNTKRIVLNKTRNIKASFGTDSQPWFRRKLRDQNNVTYFGDKIENIWASLLTFW